MSITINVTPTTGGSFTAAGVESGNNTLTVGGGIGPPGAGNVALAAGDGITISSTAGVATITSTVQGVAGSNLADLADVDATAPTSGQVLEWNGTAWAPGLDSTLTLSSTGGSDLGAAAAGTSSEAARADHVHNLPTFAEITNGTASVTGNLTLNASTGGVIVNGGTSVGSLTLNCEQNTHGVTIASPAHSAAATYTLTLPATAGSANQVLTTDGTGSLSWSNGTSGVGGGISWSSVPADSNANGTAGDVAYGGQFFYLHNGTQWNRVPLSSFGASSNVTTYRLLSETGDLLLSEGGDHISHDGTGADTLAFSTQPSNQTATNDINLDSVTLIAAAAHSNGSAVTYQWQRDEREAGDSWQNIIGETSANLTLSPYQGDDQSRYRVIASAGGLSATSNAATLTVETEWLSIIFDGAGFLAGETAWVYGPLAETVVSSGSPYIMIPTPNAADGSLVYKDSSGNPQSTQLSGAKITKLMLYKDGVLQKEDSNLYTGKIVYDGSAYQFEVISGSTLSGTTLPSGEYRVAFRLQVDAPDGSSSMGTNTELSTRVFEVT